MSSKPVAVVTGASRGAGRGIAITGRSQRSGDASFPGTIYETADAVSAAGGKGIAVHVDHADDARVKSCDRFDSELLGSAYHEDGVDEHGFAINPGPKYPEWANAQHARGSLQNMHNITTHSCEIEGDVAHAESYVIGLFLNADGKTARLLAGRYADHLERRNGEWRIVLRRSTVDVALSGDASFLSAPYFVEMGFVKGMRDKRDVSYQRPLTLDETPADRW